MLELEIPIEDEHFDVATEKFVAPKTVTIELEHSLFSLSKWESKWEVPFLGDAEKTDDQTLDYVRMMVVTPGVTDEVLSGLTKANIQQINAYISSKQSATFFREDGMPKPPGRREIITAEIVYHWMVALTIPWEAQHWHLNKLMNLIRVCNEKNNPKKKSTQSRSTIAQQRRELNAKRKAQYGTTG